MLLISHRVNTLEQLAELPTEYGVEIDLRDGLDGRIYLEHDPFRPGEDFEEYLKNYRHGLMILNIKSERVELRALELLRQYKIQKYFFLDCSFPMIKLLSDSGETNIALRFSEFEGMDTLRSMEGRAGWVWIDCFTKICVTNKGLDELNRLGYKTCFVSPELQGRPGDLLAYIQIIKTCQLRFDAICTKSANLCIWRGVSEYGS